METDSRTSQPAGALPRSVQAFLGWRSGYLSASTSADRLKAFCNFRANSAAAATPLEAAAARRLMKPEPLAGPGAVRALTPVPPRR